MTFAVNLATVGSNATATGTLITSGTAVASTSGTSIDFTGIPSWVKRITVMFNGISLSGTSQYLIQIGSGSVTTSGYASAGGIYVSGTTIIATSTAGFVMRNNGLAASLTSGIMSITNISSNSWVGSHSWGDAAAGYTGSGGGNSPALGGALDRVRITTANGTDAFDAGSLNILYE
jgi:hypothetical protein